jgi:hypothetical protein
MKSRLTLVAMALLVAGLLAGCAPTVNVAPAGAATNAKCANVVAQLPDTVSTLSRRITNGQGTGAWGEPADIVMRCGVPVPDPTSTLVCITVNGIDWLRKADPKEVFVFTTYGRTPAVAVTINSKDVKADGNQALTDLSDAVGTINAQHHCTTPSETLEGGDPVNSPVPTPAATPIATPTPSLTPKP